MGGSAALASRFDDFWPIEPMNFRLAYGLAGVGCERTCSSHLKNLRRIGSGMLPAIAKAEMGSPSHVVFNVYS